MFCRSDKIDTLILYISLLWLFGFNVCPCVHICKYVCVAKVKRNSSLTANMTRLYPSFSSLLALYSPFPDWEFFPPSFILQQLWSLWKHHLKSFGKGFKDNSWGELEEKQMQRGGESDSGRKLQVSERAEMKNYPKNTALNYETLLTGSWSKYLLYDVYE